MSYWLLHAVFAIAELGRRSDQKDVSVLQSLPQHFLACVNPIRHMNPLFIGEERYDPENSIHHQQVR